MGGNCSKYFRKEEQCQHQSTAVSSPNIGHSSSNEVSTLIMELIKPKCLKTKNNRMMNKRKRSKLNNHASEKRITKACRTLTLEDLLLASPDPRSRKLPERFNGGELYALKQFSNRIHPSSSSSRVMHEEEAAAMTSKAGESSLISCSLEVPSVGGDASSISRSQSGKLKKKVRFKLPEEADVILFYSPPGTLAND